MLPMVTEAAGARYPFSASSTSLLFTSYTYILTRDLQATLHQGAIEHILTESLFEAGVTVMRAHVEVDETVDSVCLETGIRLKKEYEASCDVQIACKD